MLGRTVLGSVALQGRSLTTAATVAARPFRGGRFVGPLMGPLLGPFMRPFMGPRRMGARCRPAGAVLLRGGSSLAMALVMMPLGAAVFPRQRYADQSLNVAQIAHLLGARDQ